MEGRTTRYSGHIADCFGGLLECICSSVLVFSTAWFLPGNCDSNQVGVLNILANILLKVYVLPFIQTCLNMSAGFLSVLCILLNVGKFPSIVYSVNFVL